MSFDKPNDEVLGMILSRAIAKEDAKKEREGSGNSAGRVNKGNVIPIKARIPDESEKDSEMKPNGTKKEVGEIIPLEKFYSAKKQRIDEDINELGREFDERKERTEILSGYENAKDAINREWEKIYAISKKIEELRREYDGVDEKHNELVRKRMEKDISDCSLEIAELQEKIEKLQSNGEMNSDEIRTIKKRIDRLDEQILLARMVIYISKGSVE